MSINVCDTFVRALESGPAYLSWVHIIEHYYGCAVVIQHQPPEVLYCIWERVLGHNECRGLLVTLEESRKKQSPRTKMKIKTMKVD